jgi:hypothetical protein
VKDKEKFGITGFPTAINLSLLLFPCPLLFAASRTSGSTGQRGGATSGGDGASSLTSDATPSTAIGFVGELSDNGRHSRAIH